VLGGPLAVLGATGYVGGLVCARARERGIPLRLVGRRREALEAGAQPGDEVRVADAGNEAALIEAFEGSFAVANLAGPFLETGRRPVAAAIAAGCHYVDTSVEQAFARLVHEGFGESAEERGVVLLTSFGVDYVPGDLAARLAAEQLEEPLDEIAVGYAVEGLTFGTSAGTRRTMAAVMRQAQVAWEDERLVDSRFGATTRRMQFPAGERTVVEWGGTEPLTVPRHTRVRRVRTYVRLPRVVAPLGRIGFLAVPFLRASAHIGRGPSEERRSRARFWVVAEARNGTELRRATLLGRDIYGLTALLVVLAADGLRQEEVGGAGALAPAEAFDARRLVERAAPFLELAG
jgi:short subunit dehydrogenase-like uncharacterized protein